MPYPCCGPRAASVFSTIKANVPCQTSVLSPIVLDSNRRVTLLLLESHIKVRPRARTSTVNRKASIALEPAAADLTSYFPSDFRAVLVGRPEMQAEQHPCFDNFINNVASPTE